MESINEGIDIENEKTNKKRPFVTEKQVGRMISKVGTIKILEKVTSVLKAAEGAQDEGESEKN